MPIIRMPTPLRPYTEGQSEIFVQGQNVADALADLTVQFPQLEKHLFSETGDLRAFVNLFLGEEDIRHLQGMETPLKDDGKLRIIPSIAGGR